MLSGLVLPIAYQKIREYSLSNAEAAEATVSQPADKIFLNKLLYTYNPYFLSLLATQSPDI